ncbi:MAG: 4Fe-4S binding protein [Paludibacterium sp.]|uniref:4Fe-4S dicluster domain-containing protein n=1 Tax=Paludibacterium sp. TaxID=1917523 RepID=UPI0025DCC8F4|nr:4Fe-4S dicluster domain-containing protein [Paludibacterium sp.]MBV8047150.1 4Fe-4S binding protein [Paludibacterium sp.]MBV8647411.1 4Fe-4S binding protein [Paludibacterium sp.]
MNRFIIAEPQNCIGCRTCEVACALAHPLPGGEDMLSPANFNPRLKVIKGARVSTPVLCRQCDDAPCANACPSGAIVRRDDSIQVLQERCVGCKTCMVACPYGAMEVTTVPQAAGVLKSRAAKAVALKCDLCIDNPAGPACIASCPTKCLHMVDQQRMAAITKQRREQAALDVPSLPL